MEALTRVDAYGGTIEVYNVVPDLDNPNMVYATVSADYRLTDHPFTPGTRIWVASSQVRPVTASERIRALRLAGL